MVVVGLIGRQGAGKETFVEFTRQILPLKKIAHVRTSAVLLEILSQLKSVEATRNNLQKLVFGLKEAFGDDIISREAEARIKENQKADIVFLDCVRLESDVVLVKSFPEHSFVFIDTDQGLRFERMKLRKEKAGEGEMTWDQFLKAESDPTEIMILQWAHETAAQTILNNGSLGEFRKKIDDDFFYPY